MQKFWRIDSFLFHFTFIKLEQKLTGAEIQYKFYDIEVTV